MNTFRPVPILLLLTLICAPLPPAHAESVLSWRDALRQTPTWHATGEAIRIAENVLLFQHENGGWPKNINPAAILTDTEKNRISQHQSEPRSPYSQTTIDNSATCAEMRYLARMVAATDDERYATAFLRGLDYLLEAQYENGGWPQFYPLRGGYHDAITFNDNAMIGVMRLLQDVAHGHPPYAFVDKHRRIKAVQAINNGVQLILDTQIQVDGRPTAWCAQHDPRDLSPAQGRSYEHPSISGSESANIVRFLMSLEDPTPEVIASIQHAIAWFEAAQIPNTRMIEIEIDGRRDRIIETSPEYESLWARFYEIGTNRPIFSGRDGVIKYKLAEIEHERRVGYQWFGTWGKDLLEEEYPVWKEAWLHEKNDPSPTSVTVSGKKLSQEKAREAGP